MTIEQIDGSKVLILLGSQDMKDFSLEYKTLSFTDPHSRRILLRLLTLACTKTGVNIENKKMIVEALPHPNGCLILLTLTPKNKRKIYKIKRSPKNLCCIFKDSEALIQASVALSRKSALPENSVYLYKDKYCLIVADKPVSLSALAMLEEFSESFVCSGVVCARIRENGKEISSQNAMENIGKFFKSEV